MNKTQTPYIKRFDVFSNILLSLFVYSAIFSFSFLSVSESIIQSGSQDLCLVVLR